MRTPLSLLIVGLLAFALGGCPQQTQNGTGNDGQTGDTTGDTTGDAGDNTGGSTGDNAGSGDSGTGSGDVSDSALSFNGTVSGSVASQSSTAAASGSGRATPPAQDLDGATLWLTDLHGDRLVDADGNAFADLLITSLADFELSNLPVGVDIVVNVDVNGDGKPDLFTIINIPQDGSGETGTLAGVVIDPLSTLVVGRLMHLVNTKGLDLADLDISPSALIARIRDAYENLLDAAGIDTFVTLDDIADMTSDQLAELFDLFIPVTAQRAMLMCDGNIDLKRATDVGGVVLAVARVLVQGGFAVADDPEGYDLSSLGTLPHVTILSFDDFMEARGGQAPPNEPQGPRPTIYVSDLGEPDRNLVGVEERDDRHHPGPIFSEHVLARMAQLFLDNKTIALEDLYHIVVDAETGMGARFIYDRVFVPGGAPLLVFQTLDGEGVELNLDELFTALADLHAVDPNADAFEEVRSQVHQTIVDFLAETVEPSLDDLFAGILRERVPSVDELAAEIRAHRAHLPFSISGPAQLFVIGDGDRWRDPNVTIHAVTVDVELDADGNVTGVTYNADGAGEFYLRYGEVFENGAGIDVEFISVARGCILRNHVGLRQHFDMADAGIFSPVNGESFFDAFSESGQHYPGAPALRIPNPNYDPAQAPDPVSNPPDFEIFVLVTQPGPDGTPVRVNYEAGTATYHAEGQYYLAFNENTPSQGSFDLVSADGRFLEDTPGDPATRVHVLASEVQGTAIAPETFTLIYGIEVPNPRYLDDGAPYYDDINNNDVEDAGEPRFDYRNFLYDPNDWRSTYLEKYYRRADNNGFIGDEGVDFNSDTPRAGDGVELVPRNLKPRLNAYKFGRPNVTVNLLAAFSPPEFFDGTHDLSASTRLNPFQALALLNLVFDSIHNVQGQVDYDGDGPLPEREELITAELFTPPVGDPLLLIVDQFEARSQ